jgi:hypothetical protein
LKGFIKTDDLAPGESQKIVFQLTQADLSIWNSDIHDWEVVEGTYEVMVGSSVCSIHASGQFDVLEFNEKEKLFFH